MKKLLALLRHMLLICLCFLTAFPFVWMILSSLKTKEEVMDPSCFFPARPDFQSYGAVFSSSLVPRYLFNSLFVAVCVVLLQVLCCSLFSYGITFFKFRGKRLLLGLVFLTYMVPTASTYIPCYMILSKLGLLDSYRGLILSNGVSVFGIFLLRQAFRHMPEEALEAARLDGAGHLTLLTRIVFPMTRSSFITFILLSFIGTYNSYLWPSLITDSPSLSLISQGLRRFLYEDGAYGTKWPLVMAAGAAAVVPLLLLFAAVWRWIFDGITDFGTKG